MSGDVASIVTVTATFTVAANSGGDDAVARPREPAEDATARLRRSAGWRGTGELGDATGIKHDPPMRQPRDRAAKCAWPHEPDPREITRPECPRLAELHPTRWQRGDRQIAARVSFVFGSKCPEGWHRTSSGRRGRPNYARTSGHRPLSRREARRPQREDGNRNGRDQCRQRTQRQPCSQSRGGDDYK